MTFLFVGKRYYDLQTIDFFYFYIFIYLVAYKEIYVTVKKFDSMILIGKSILSIQESKKVVFTMTSAVYYSISP